MINKPKGIEDVFPDRINHWNHILQCARDVFKMNNYKELIIPVMEFTEVFARGIGDETDIVSKEMFTFEDRGGRSLTLRPEGTASVVRAYVENGDYNRLSTCKFFYMGPMFRAENVQRGRLRQFNQLGAELFGGSAPYYDFEIIAMIDAFTRKIGIKDYSILINSIGCPECRKDYIEKLKAYYSDKLDHLCADCKKRYTKNTLRLLDCKEDSCTALKKEAPRITDYICTECRDHYSDVKGHLTANNISFREDPNMVRGLDYYTKTTFEFVTNSEVLGGQSTFAAGGRYDNLVETFGGKPTPAVGFAAGIERIYILTEELKSDSPGIDIFMIHTGGATLTKAIEITAKLRNNNYSVDLDPAGKGFKSQFKKADREKARYAVIIGEDELATGKCTIKDQNSGKQDNVVFENIIEWLQ